MNMLHFNKFWCQQIVPAQRDRSQLTQSWRRGLLLATSSLFFAVVTSTVPDRHVAAAIFDRTGRKLPDREVNSDRVNWQMLSAAKGRKYNGIGLIDLDAGRCTGFFIATGNHPTAPAYVLTNGHCQGKAGGLPKQDEIVVDRATDTNFVVNYFYDFAAERLTIPVRKLVYSTMKNNDIAILELTKTQGELIRAGINPLTIDNRPAPLSEPIVAVGIPSAGVKNTLNYLHSTTCQTGQTVNVKEDIYNWQRSIRHQCSVVGGMSGSPLISLKTNRVVGIINTGINDSAAKQPQCSLNRPCEVNANGTIQTFERENYAQLVDRIPSCFDRQGKFNLFQSSCQLERP